MRNIYLLILISIFFISSTVHAAHEVRNGGDIIKCYGKKPVSLDYAIGVKKYSENDLYRPNSIEESLERVGNVIKEKNPELSTSFEHFTKSIFGKNEKYQWIKVNYPLEDIEDEDLGLGMKLCAPIGFEKYPEFVQAVIRKTTNGKSVFFYEGQILEALAPLQLSFLLVHEWLWNYSTDVVKNREFNFMVHRK